MPASRTKISEELRHREQRLARIVTAKEKLERGARRSHERELRERAARARAGAEGESDPIELKRKLTRARQAAEEADDAGVASTKDVWLAMRDKLSSAHLKLPASGFDLHTLARNPRSAPP